MDIKRTLQARANRRTRLERPFSNFFETFQQCIAAGEMILSGSVDPRVACLIERSAVISTVTAIEVHYRDILDFIFRYCEPTYFEPHLKQLFPDKFQIEDLLQMHRHQVHPLELVSSAQSFQNVERIDKVFSMFVPNGGLWKSVLQLQVRLKDDPTTETSFSRDELVALKRVFDLRHELVHDPARRSFFNERTLEDLWAAAYLVFGSNLVLTKAIEENATRYWGVTQTPSPTLPPGATAGLWLVQQCFSASRSKSETRLMIRAVLTDSRSACCSVTHPAETVMGAESAAAQSGSIHSVCCEWNSTAGQARSGTLR